MKSVNVACPPAPRAEDAPSAEALCSSNFAHLVESVDLEIAPNDETEKETVPQEPNPLEPRIEVETIQEQGGEVNEEPMQTQAAAPA